MIYDRRAIKILFDTYWSANGWKSAYQSGWTPNTPRDELAFAIRAGVMFSPRHVSHQNALELMAFYRGKIAPEQVGAAFVASLSENNLAMRSALGSYAVALNMPLHPFCKGRDGFSCVVCGAYETDGEQDLSILSFERHKWGGVRHADPFYIAFDLERFLADPSSSPSDKDQLILEAIFKAVEEMPPGAKLADLLRAVTPIVPGNKDQRRTLIGILGYAGILPIPNHPSFLRSYTPHNERKDTPWSKDDWPYPIRWWKGGNGIDREAARFWFGR